MIWSTLVGRYLSTHRVEVPAMLGTASGSGSAAAGLEGLVCPAATDDDCESVLCTNNAAPWPSG